MQVKINGKKEDISAMLVSAERYALRQEDIYGTVDLRIY